MADLYEIDFNHEHWRWASDLPEWLKKVVGPVYRPTGVPQARPQELEDLIQDGWLVEVGEETT